MKKAIALLVVLGFIIVLISISTALFNIYDKYSKNSYKYITQDALYIRNIKKILKNYLKTKDIYKIFNEYHIKLDNNSLKVTISPLQNRVNINQYLINNKINLYIDDMLDNILNFYQVKDPILFKNLLLDTIDSDTISRSNHSEIIKEDQNFQNNQIYNYNHFKKILDYYNFLTNDTNIYKIDWNKYIFFGEKKRYSLDCNLITIELAQFIGVKFQNDIISCKNLIQNKNSKAFDLKPFDKNSTYLLDIKIEYDNNKIDLIYDTKSGSSYIEKHFIY